MTVASARDILNDAMKIIGVYESGRTMSSAQGVEGLRRLNQMIDGFNNKYLLAYQRVQRTHSLTEGTAEYTLGSGGTIDVARPLRIESAFTRDSADSDHTLEIISNEEYSEITRKAKYNSYPNKLYVRYAYPLVTIYLDPAPQANLTLYLECTGLISTFATLDTDASLPPGYERMLTYNVAEEWAPLFKRTVSQDVKEIARESLADIKDTNNREVPIMSNPFANTDSEVFNGMFDIAWPSRG